MDYVASVKYISLENLYKYSIVTEFRKTVPNHTLVLFIINFQHDIVLHFLHYL